MRETEDDVEKDCRERAKQGRVDNWNVANAAAQNRVGWEGSENALCAF